MLCGTRTGLLYLHNLIVVKSPKAAGALLAFGIEKILSRILIKRIHVNKPEKLKLLPIHSVIMTSHQNLY